MTDIYDIDFELRRAVSNLLDTLEEEYGISDKILDVIEHHFMKAVDAVNDELSDMEGEA